MVYDFVLTQGDNLKRWRLALSDDNGPIALTLQDTVTLHMNGGRTGTVMDRPAVIDPNPQPGLEVPNVCYYDFLSVDTQVPDVYSATLQVTFADGTSYTFPTPPALQVLISAALT